jgi:hypothetical protein
MTELETKATSASVKAIVDGHQGRQAAPRREGALKTMVARAHRRLANGLDLTHAGARRARKATRG